MEQGERNGVIAIEQPEHPIALDQLLGAMLPHEREHADVLRIGGVVRLDPRAGEAAGSCDRRVVAVAGGEVGERLIRFALDLRHAILELCNLGHMFVGGVQLTGVGLPAGTLELDDR